MRSLLVAAIAAVIVSGSAGAGPAERAYHKGDLDRAISLYNERLKKEPDDMAARYNLGNAAFRKGNVAEAEEAYRRALSGKDLNIRARAGHNLGNALMKDGKIDDAIRAYVRSLHDQPGNEDTKYNLELALSMKQQQEQRRRQEDQREEKQGDQQQEQGVEQEDQNNQSQPNGEQQKSPEQGSEQQQARQSEDRNNEPPRTNSAQEQDAKDSGGKQGDQGEGNEAKGNYSREEAERVLDGLAEDERRLQEDRLRAQGRNLKVEKDW